MAQRTGLEPATPGVTGRYSNRLNYRCVSLWTFAQVTRLTGKLRGFFNLEAGKPDSEKYGAADGTRTRDPPGVTGRYSNRLNYRCASVEAFKSFHLAFARLSEVVGDDGIEPPTFCL